VGKADRDVPRKPRPWARSFISVTLRRIHSGFRRKRETDIEGAEKRLEMEEIKEGDRAFS